MRRLSLVVLVNSLDAGGAERVAMDLARGLKTNGHQVKMVCLHDGGFYCVRARQHMPVEALGLPYRIRANELVVLSRVIRSARPDVVQCFHTNPNRWGPLAAKLANRPVVVTGLQNCYYHETTFHHRMDWLLFRFAAHAVSCSEAVRRFHVARKRYPEHKVSKIYNSVDVERFRPGRERGRLRKALGVGERSLLVATVASLIPQKGHGYLLAAAQHVIRELKQVTFVWIGDGALRQSLQAEAAARGLARHVILLGVREDVPEVLADCDLLVLPSVWEGFGLVLVEAMASGLPVVASAVDGVVEVVEHRRTGILVAPGDVRSLAGAICRLARDPGGRRRMGEAARRRAVARFAGHEMVARYEELYRNLLELR